MLPAGPLLRTQVERAVPLVAWTVDFPCADLLDPALVRTVWSLAQQSQVQLTQDLLRRMQCTTVSMVEVLVQEMRHDGDQPRPGRS